MSRVIRIRKRHVYVPQDAYAAALLEVGAGELADFAEHFDVSLSSARRNLDGLVAQGLATRRRGTRGRGLLYTTTGDRR